MTAPELKYGRRNVAKMIREWDALRQAIRAEGTPMVQSALDQVEEHIDYAYRADLAAVQPAQEVHEEQNTEQRERFWNWLPLAYRDGHIGEQAKFTKYNMEVAHYAGWCHAIEPQPDRVILQRIGTGIYEVPSSPDHRDEVIARLVEAADAVDNDYISQQWGPEIPSIEQLRAAIAAAKAVQP